MGWKKLVFKWPPEERKKKDNALSDHMAETTIQHMPDEILVEIFCHLPLEDLILRAQYVCKRWRTVADTGQIFRRVVYKPDVDTSEEEVIKILHLAPKLQRVVLLRSHTRRVVETLCQCCKDLRQVNLRNGHIDMLREVAMSCPKMEFLTLKGLKDFSESSLLYLEDCSYLKVLKLTLRKVPVGLLVAVALGCPLLQELCLYEFPYYSEGLTFLLQRRGSNLQSLSLSCCFDGEKCFYPLIMKHCKNLRNLHVWSHNGRGTI